MHRECARLRGYLAGSHPHEVLHGPVHAGSDIGSADLLEVVTGAIEHLARQAAEVDLDLGMPC